MPKADKLEHGKRVETVRQLILSGTEATRIVQTVAEQWGLKDRQGWNYIKHARALIQDATLPTRAYLLAEHVAARRSLRERARKKGDLRAELLALQDEAKLFGLYAPERIEVDDVRDTPDHDLIREFEAIVDTARTRAGSSDSG
jgi:hypothetical protein